MARASSSLTELVKEIQEILGEYGSSGFEVDASMEILSRTRLEARMETWRAMPVERRPEGADRYEGLLEDDSNEWFALLKVVA
ncbi:MAG: hypothetical protein OK441_05605 [Thaumarchaeota archaeon]|nr:hypothetical protein [Nitrososphaerota archaeon]